MDSAKREKMIERVRMLLAIADDNAVGNEGEKETARRQAFKLMARFGIDGVLDDAGSGGREPERFARTMSGSYQMEKAMLLYRIAEALGCRALLDGKSNGNRRIVGYGMPADVDMVLELFSIVEPQMSAAIYAYPGGAADRRAFGQGFASTVGLRLRAQRANATREASRDSVGAELVLRDASAAVDAAFKTAYPSVRQTSMRRSGYGRNDGARAGRQANLSTARKVSTASFGSITA